jgi:ferredoxin-NADP reductase
MQPSAGTVSVLVRSITYEAAGIVALELTPAPQSGLRELPAFTAGAHIDLHLRNGFQRSYSLVNPQEERHRYVIAVQNDATSRGGSRFVHESMRVGEVLEISAPRNHFALVEDAPHTVLIAGGIGITPLWCMAQRLEALGRPWELYVCARTGRHAALLPHILQADRAGRVHLHFDDEQGGRLLDLAAIVNGAAAGTHFYCCGPTPMLGAFEKATSGQPAGCIHTEYFSPKEPPVTEGGFTVVLARSGKSFAVLPGKTILGTLLDNRVDAPYSCTEGVCGECETRVIEGIPDHRDVVLTPDQRAANRTMMICCSGCKGDRLVLDL